MCEVRCFTPCGYLVTDVVVVVEEIFEDFGDG